MHVMAGHVERNEQLEQETELRINENQVAQETSCGASVSDHVKDCAESTTY